MESPDLDPPGKGAPSTEEIAAAWLEVPGMLAGITEVEFAEWRAEHGIEVELSEVHRAALRIQDARVRRARSALSGDWGGDDWADGIPAPPEAREGITRRGLDHREERERLEARLDDDAEAVLSDPPGGRSQWPAFWPPDRGRDGHRERS